MKKKKSACQSNETVEDCLSKEMRPDFMGLEKLYNPSIIKAQIDFDNFEIVAIST